MKVTIYERDGIAGTTTVYVRITLDDGTVKRQSLGISYKSHPTSARDKDDMKQIKALAEVRASELYKELLLTGMIPVIKERKAASISDICMRIRDRRKKQKTRDNWQTLHKHLVEHGIGKISANRVTIAECVSFRMYLEHQLAQSTGSVYYGHFRALLRTAAIEGDMPDDITAKIGTIRMPDIPIDYLEQHELDQLLRTPIASDTVRRAFAFACLTGMRYSDLRGLQWEQIHETQWGVEIRMRQQKTGAYLILPLSPDTAAWIGQLYDADGLKKVGPVFVGLPESPGLTLKRWALRAGLAKHVHWHMSRHTYATLALAAGVDLKVVSKMIGHKTIKSTEVYAKVVDASLRHAAMAVTSSVHAGDASLRVAK
jgi:integrase